MMKKNKRFLLLFISSLIVVSIFKVVSYKFLPINLNTASAQTVVNSTNIPQSILPCLPQGESIKNTYIDAIVEYQGDKYYLVGIVEEKPTIFENDFQIVSLETIILRDEIGCLIKQPREIIRTHSKQLFVPIPVARLLSLENIKKKIEKIGSKEDFLKGFDEVLTDAADGPWIFFPEDAWAYEQLGLELPNPHVIVESADDPKAQAPTPGIK